MIRVDRKLNSTDVLDALTDLFILHGSPEYIRPDNAPEFIAQKVRDWIAAAGAKTTYIEPSSPFENRYGRADRSMRFCSASRKSLQDRKQRKALRGQDEEGGEHQIGLSTSIRHEHQIAQSAR